MNPAPHLFLNLISGHTSLRNFLLMRCASWGEMLKATERAGARFHEGNKKVPSLNNTPTLADLGNAYHNRRCMRSKSRSASR
jgi:hypothetical protein